MEKENYVRFVGKITARSRSALLRAVDSAVRDRVDRLHLIMSSQAGSMMLAVSLYNYLRGAPVEIHTYNFGLVSGAGLPLFCAGARRLCTPHARFVVGCADVALQPNMRFDEASLESALKLQTHAKASAGISIGSWRLPGTSCNWRTCRCVT